MARDHGFSELFTSLVPQGYRQVLALLEARGKRLVDQGRVWDWTSVLCESLTGQRGLPVEALLELEAKLAPVGVPAELYEAVPLMELYAEYVLGRTPQEIEEAKTVASFLPTRPVVEKVSAEEYPALHAALSIQRSRIRSRGRLRFPKFAENAPRFEAILRPYTPSPSWSVTEFLAHSLEDSWQLIGRRREDIAADTLEFLRNSSGENTARYMVALEDAHRPQLATWRRWLEAEKSYRGRKVWSCHAGGDILAASTLWTAVLMLEDAEGDFWTGLSQWAQQEGSCIMGLCASDVDELIRRGYTPLQAAQLLYRLRSAAAFRLHFYEGLPVEYAASVVGWDDD